MVIPVVVTIFADRTFTFITKTPPAADSCSRRKRASRRAVGQPNRSKVGKVTRAQVKKIAEIKMPDLNATDLESRHADDRRHRPVDGAGGGRLMRDPRQEVPRRGRQGRTAPRDYPTARGGRAGEGRARSPSSTRRSTSRCGWASIRGTPTRSCAARSCCPHGTGKTVRVLVITAGRQGARKPRPPGADFVGIEYIQKIKDGWLECDVIVATPDVMGQLGPAGQDARPARPDAEPEGGHGHDGRRPRRSGRSRRARSSSGWTRPATCTRRSARCRSAPTQLEREPRRPSWTRSSGPSRRRRRASTSGSATVSSTMGPGVRLDTAGYR